jgi:hypothetical protein
MDAVAAAAEAEAEALVADAEAAATAAQAAAQAAVAAAPAAAAAEVWAGFGDDYLDEVRLPLVDPSRHGLPSARNLGANLPGCRAWPNALLMCQPS